VTKTIRTIAALRETVQAWRREGQSVGMVPTMGALHEGHLSLMRAAQSRNARVIVTLFVNPTQFAPTEDLRAYPRDEEADRRKLEALDVAVLFAPAVSEMYPAGFDTRIVVGGPAAGLESDFRPQHFSGVATIVAKLLLAGMPDRAYFGEKDFQQLLVVKKLVRDLNIPTEIVGCPTMREPDGLAMSSRNAYLSPEERARAPRLHAIMRDVAGRIRASSSSVEFLNQARRTIAEAGFAIDYLELRSADTLAAVEDITGAPMRLLAAARLGTTRLIDNVAV
jgi:pantoate--beta-alanine ligase